MIKLPYKPRLLNKLIANYFGYFWLPCYLCGKEYGGHEKPQGHIQLDAFNGRSVCPICSIKYKEELEENNIHYMKLLIAKAIPAPAASLAPQ